MNKEEIIEFLKNNLKIRMYEDEKNMFVIQNVIKYQ
jgi:hypothetical protein